MKWLVLAVLAVVVASLGVWIMSYSPIHIQVYHTESGAEYFCTFEDKDVFFEYMMEKNHD